MRPARRSRPGVTLVELVVVLAILGVVAGVTGLAYAAARPAPAPDDPLAAIARARAEALASRRATSVAVRVEGRTHAVTVLPDGSVLADPGLRVDRFTGRAERVEQ